MISADILIAHPGKHHVLRLAAGCTASKLDVKLMVPLYQKGLATVLSMVPGSVGQRARGYFDQRIPTANVISPLGQQIAKTASFILPSSFKPDRRFDLYTEREIRANRLRCKVFVSMQDYMPRSVRAAKEQGALIWSDQILNSSPETLARLQTHERLYGLPHSSVSDEVNLSILQIADLITVPSSYCFDGVKDFAGKDSRIEVIPYGADAARFFSTDDQTAGPLTILARANSVRKGGHLLLDCLEQYGEKLLQANNSRPIDVIVIGRFEPCLKSRLAGISMPDGLRVLDVAVAHEHMPALYRRGQIFVMPSLSESLSLACLEAMHTGLPLVVSRYCGIDGMSSDIGVELDSLTPAALGQSLLEMLRKRRRWPDMAKAARSLAEQFTWTNYERQIALAADTACQRWAAKSSNGNTL